MLNISHNLFIQLNNQHAIILQNDATLYYGQIHKNQIQGKGTIIYPDGAYYIGIFHQNQPINQGTFVKDNLQLNCQWGSQLICTEQTNKTAFPTLKDQTFNTTKNDNFTYIGEKTQNGLGLVIHKNNKFHYGLFKNKQFNGFSAITLKNSDQYIGNMKEGKFDGEGLFYKKKENKTYKSKFENGKCREIMSTFEGEIQKNDIIAMFSNLSNIKCDSNKTQYSFYQIQDQIMSSYKTIMFSTPVKKQKCLETEYPDMTYITQSSFSKKGYTQKMTPTMETKNSVVISDFLLTEQNTKEKDDDEISDDLKEYTQSNLNDQQVPMLAGKEANLETLRNVLMKLMDKEKSKTTRRQVDQGCQADLVQESMEIPTKRQKYSILNNSVSYRNQNYLRKQYLSSSVTTRIGLNPSFITVRPINKPYY